MLKHMLSGTAIAVLVAANPALAQTQTPPELETPQAQEQMPETEGAEMRPEGDEALDTEAAEIEDEFDPETEAAEIEEEFDLETEAAELDADVDETVTTAERPTETFLTMQEDEDILASELMGVSVENTEGETLGSINDVVIHDDLGVKAVVIGVGGFLGLGQKHVAVNYDEIDRVRNDVGDITLVFAATTEELENAPEFQTLEDQIAEAEQEDMQMQQDMQMQPDAPAAPPPQ